MTDDNRTWNNPRIAKELRALIARVDALGGGPVQPNINETLDVGPYSEFVTWQRNSLNDLVRAEGTDAASPKRLHVLTSTLSAAWAGLMLAEGATYEEVGKFMEWANERIQYVNGYSKWRRAQSQVPQADLPVTETVPASRNAIAEMQAAGLIKATVAD